MCLTVIFLKTIKLTASYKRYTQSKGTQIKVKGWKCGDLNSYVYVFPLKHHNGTANNF